MSRSFVVVQRCEGKGSCVDVSIHELCFYRPMSRSFVVVQLCEVKGLNNNKRRRHGPMET
jgi:hypothetical protein